MRIFGAFVVGMLSLAPAVADTPALREAQRRLLRGNYAEARQQFAALANKGKQQVPAAIGLSRSWRSEGEYDKAQQALQAALKDRPGSGEIWAELADLHYLRGHWDNAQQAARKALEDGKGQFLAHWVLARVYRDRGDLKQAGKELLWFIRAYNNEEPTDPEQLLLVGQAECERARWDSRLSDQFQFVLNEIYSPISKKHKDQWLASYLTGALFLEKYNKAKADKGFTRALAINPRASEVHVAKGIAALSGFEIKTAEEAAERALNINPRLVEALCLKADVALAGGDAQEALKYLAKARAVNPRAEPTLARIAACLYLQHKGDDLKALAAEIEKHNPKPGLFYHELAEQLDQRKRYDDAERYYRLSIKLQPKLVWARNSLGMLYMRLGREEEAREILDKAFENDPFNVRVFNTLQVLDHLKPYTTIKTPHFLVRFDKNNDQVLAAFIAKYLENIYKEFADAYQYRPAGPFLIEVFNKHQMFSGRVVALPDLHTIGASTGRMVAMVSPRDKSGIIGKPFNWNRVLRHELTHVFNLEQTHFQVPHWLTEGLAVHSEKLAMPPMWNRILRERVTNKDLLNLDNIHLGFIRPKSPEEWQLAYLQSFLYVEYLKSAFKEKAIAGLLDAFAGGMDTSAALQKVCQVSKEAFEKGYRAHLQEKVKNLTARPAVKRLSFEELKAAHSKDPENAEVAGQLAERYLALGNRTEARKLADAALARMKGQPIASYVKAKLLKAGGEGDAAMALLEAAVDEKALEIKVLRLLGQMQFEAKKFAEAARTFELGRKEEPYENIWLKLLAKSYLQFGQTDKLIDVLKALAPTDADDLATRRELADLLLKAGRHAEAEKWAREALEIDVLDPEAQETLEAALRGQNKDAELRELQQLLGKS
jgi:tetratricopeptide (TPR) repeat protein